MVLFMLSTSSHEDNLQGPLAGRMRMRMMWVNSLSRSTATWLRLTTKQCKLIMALLVAFQKVFEEQLSTQCALLA